MIKEHSLHCLNIIQRHILMKHFFVKHELKGVLKLKGRKFTHVELEDLFRILKFSRLAFGCGCECMDGIVWLLVFYWNMNLGHTRSHPLS